MGRIPASALSRYLLDGRISRRGCQAVRRIAAPSHPVGSTLPTRCPVRVFHAAAEAAVTLPPSSAVPLRKQLKDEEKKARQQGVRITPKAQSLKGWELTVGIEIHAQLNTSRKLFSPASMSFNDDPNSHVALFDVAMPGSQPLFQRETLIPAIRAALSLNCDIEHISRFDRKHYFWWDQPSGYQVTQYYEPFAKNGHIKLEARDGIAHEDREGVTVRIKQVQLEQDTAKTLAGTDNMRWLDFNRVGAPLIEIITEPDMHHPRTAAVLVRKIQQLLNTVDACISGMETGGLRADVNVSVRRTGDQSQELGKRVEIKNLSTIKAIEDAIISERNRQIEVLEGGGAVAGETRGWSIRGKTTRRLRGKEGEVDYRYMPDPDIAPVVIGKDLVEHLRTSLPLLPDDELNILIEDYGLTPKDALSLLALDNGARVQYFYKVLSLHGNRATPADSSEPAEEELKNYTALVGNWIIHEFGRLTTSRVGSLTPGELTFSPTGDCAQIDHSQLADLLYFLYHRKITGKVAKELLLAIYLGDVQGDVEEAIAANDLWFQELSDDEYRALREQALEGEEQLLNTIVGRDSIPRGKFMYLVGKMMRLGPTERVHPATAEKFMSEWIGKLRE